MAENPQGSFRNYPPKSPAAKFYKLQHENQRYQQVLKIMKQMSQQPKKHVPFFEELFNVYGKVIDKSDPDLPGLPQWIHAFQSAERARLDNAEDWMQLLALIHDVGKFRESKQYGGFQQYQLVGDTYPLGCRFRQKIVCHYSFENNPDNSHPVYSSDLGVYKQGIGFDNMIFTLSNDNFLADLVKINCKKGVLPEAFEYVVRYHSFYPWHKEKQYEEFESQKDKQLKKYVLQHNKYDLYSKSTNVDLKEEEKKWEEAFPYYREIFNKYFNEIWMV